MGKLKPIGSEKLEGMDKIKRMIEISRYNEHIPNPINEDKSVEYKITLSDNNNYQIAKEKNGYVIKKSINESEFDYLEPMKNRKYYSSYSQAMKRLNLITKEVNTLNGNESNTSLFTEGEEEGKKKYFLKVNTNEQAAAPAQATPPSPAPEPAPVPSPEMTDELPSAEPEMTDELPAEEPTSDETDTEDEVVTFKTIQKLTGKLGQKIREFTSNEENKMSSNDIKYVINSILSALNLNDLESDDKEEIMNKFEGGEDISSEEPSMETEPSIEDTETSGEEMTPEPPPSPEGEMGEEWNEEELPNLSKMRRLKKRGMRTDELTKMEEMIEGIFSESKVDNILKKYFVIDEKEKKTIKENTEKKNEKLKIEQRIKNISESISQEVSSRKFVKQNPNAKLIGKTKSKNLVFENNNKKVVISPKGQIL
jgi:hypothetical protein